MDLGRGPGDDDRRGFFFDVQNNRFAGDLSEARGAAVFGFGGGYFVAAGVGTGFSAGLI